VVGGRLVIDDDGAADPRLAELHARIERYWAGVRRLEDLLDPPPHDPARTMALIAQGDEVLDWREMASHCAGAACTVLPGGDHALSDFPDHLGAIERFLGLA